MVTVLEPIPGYYSFAVSAVPAWNWTEEKRVRYSALQAEARQQAKAAGIVLDADLISGDEVGSIVNARGDITQTCWFWGCGSTVG